MNNKYVGFKELLREKFIYSKQYDIREVARKMGMAVSSLYHYCEERGPNFPVDRLGLLYNATLDRDFHNYALRDTPLMLTNRQIPTDQKPLKDETLEAAASGGMLVKTVLEALRDNVLSDNEKKAIVNAINATEKELEDMRQYCVCGGNGDTLSHACRDTVLRVPTENILEREG